MQQASCHVLVLLVEKLVWSRTHDQDADVWDATQPYETSRFLFLPRSEHWITRRWHWHLKGHTGPTGMTGGLRSRGSRPDPASSSIMKSRKPDWRKGRAQQAVTRSKERQADLMVLLAGSLGDEKTSVQRFGWIHIQNSRPRFVSHSM